MNRDPSLRASSLNTQAKPDYLAEAITLLDEIDGLPLSKVNKALDIVAMKLLMAQTQQRQLAAEQQRANEVMA